MISFMIAPLEKIMQTNEDVAIRRMKQNNGVLQTDTLNKVTTEELLMQSQKASLGSGGQVKSSFTT